MIYTITLNPSLDYVMNIEDYKDGETNRSTSEEIHIGGKGINVSIVLSSLGIETTAIGIASGFTGEYITKTLDEIGINNDFTKNAHGISRINIKIKSENETEINSNGPVYDDNTIKDFFKKLDKVQNGDFLILSGSVPKSLNDDIYKRILHHVKLKDIQVVVDATGRLLTNTLDENPFLIKPNRAELGEIFGTQIKTDEDIKKYAGKLIERGAQNVIISLGKDGAAFINKDNFYRVQSPKGKLINSVGSGDSMVAGFIYAYSKFKDYEKAFKFSVASGSATAFSKKLATKKEIDLLYRNMWKG